MLKKRRVKKGKAIAVTFELPADVAEESVRVAGDFTGWEPSCPLERQKDGTWRATVQLEPGREYQFRYVADGERWLDDPQADRYAPNPYGQQNSVLVT